MINDKKRRTFKIKGLWNFEQIKLPSQEARIPSQAKKDMLRNGIICYAQIGYLQKKDQAL